MGRLIAIEGLDGAGKNTQSDLLCKYLSEKGVPVLKIDFPNYSSKSSTLVKMYLDGELGDSPDDTNCYAASAFFACDRYISYVTGWKSFLEREDAVVVANRYTTANAYHQLSKLPKEEWDPFLEWLWDLEFKKFGLPEPDDVICLAVSPEISQRNIERRCRRRHVQKDIHERDREYLAKCRGAAEYAASRLGWSFIDCTDGERQLPVAEVFEKIKAALNI